MFKAIFHCSRFGRAGEATDFNLVKNHGAGPPRVVQLPSVSARTKVSLRFATRPVMIMLQTHMRGGRRAAL